MFDRFTGEDYVNYLNAYGDTWLTDDLDSLNSCLAHISKEDI